MRRMFNPPHPGEVLKDGVFEGGGISVTEAAQQLGVSRVQLSRRYGFQKFIIVVPSVAIREGVLKNIDITAEHFRALYNNLPFEHFVYDAKKVNRLRQFATSSTLQILVINIDAFRKNFTGTEAEQK